MKLFKGYPKIYKRIALAKTLGLLMSLVGAVFFIASGIEDQFNMLIIGLFFWYPTLGGLAGLMGILDKHPLFKFKLGIWRSIVVGAFMNAMLAFMIFDQLQSFTFSMTGIEFGTFGMFAGFMFEGAFVAGFIDYVTTKKYGEGKELMKKK